MRLVFKLSTILKKKMYFPNNFIFYTEAYTLISLHNCQYY